MFVYKIELYIYIGFPVHFVYMLEEKLKSTVVKLLFVVNKKEVLVTLVDFFFFQVGRFICIKLCFLRLNGDMGVLPLSLPVDGGFAKLEHHSKEDFQKMLTEWQEHLGSLQVLSLKSSVRL